MVPELIDYPCCENSFDLVKHVALFDTLGDAGNVLSQSLPGCLNFGISILRRS